MSKSTQPEIDLIAAFMNKHFKGMSEAECARRIGTDQANLHRYLSAEYMPRTSTFLKFCREMNIPGAELKAFAKKLSDCKK